ncbi:MAG: hypothetical protein JNL79_17425 [Myxococcales bacterium]|nr:hypothetical protein [Myxococcales bacterium]
MGNTVRASRAVAPKSASKAVSLEEAAAGASGEPKPRAPSKSKASSARVEPFEKDVLDRLREEVLACVRRRSPNERRLAGLCRALAPHSALARTLLAEVGELLVQKKAFDRDLFVAAVRGLGELSDKRAVPLVKAGAEHDVCATAALCAAAWLTDPALAPILNKAATQRSAHIAFTAELARVIRGESPGAHLRGLAPKIKESHRIALCAEVLVPIARIPKVAPGVQHALAVLRDAERHLGRWLVMAEVAVHGGDLEPLREARTKSSEGPSGARAAWAYVAWALDPSMGPPSARPTTELVARLSDRPSADRDTKFLFRLAHAGVRTTKPLLEAFARDLAKEDDDAVRAAGYLVRDHGREDLVAAIHEVAKNSQRDDLRGLAAAVLYDAGKKELAIELAKQLVENRATSLFGAAWGTLVLLSAAGRFPAGTPVAHEPAVRWLQAGWLE